MTNVQELWRNITAATLTCVILLPFADNGSFLSFLVGFAYAWFFEYFYHRCIGHTEFFQLQLRSTENIIESGAERIFFQEIALSNISMSRGTSFPLPS